MCLLSSFQPWLIEKSANIETQYSQITALLVNYNKIAISEIPLLTSSLSFQQPNFKTLSIQHQIIKCLRNRKCVHSDSLHNAFYWANYIFP